MCTSCINIVHQSIILYAHASVPNGCAVQTSILEDNVGRKQNISLGWTKQGNAKWVQTGSNRANLDQTGPTRIKPGYIDPNLVKWGQTRPNWDKWGKTGPNGAN